MAYHITPIGIPPDSRRLFEENYALSTQGSDRLFLMAGDQKVEHMNDDFVGDNVSSDDADPENLFRIASEAPVGCFATQLGLIHRYGMDYKDIPYLVKINSKTHLVGSEQRDPLSRQWQSIEQVADFIRYSHLQVVGVGYTIYPGSEYEPAMFTEASRLIYDAHQRGLLAVVWAYPRGKGVGDREQDAHIIAGAAGLGACLGADFVKVNPPINARGETDARLLGEAVNAAGRTGVICAGGNETTSKAFLQRVYDQIHDGGTAGCATGRNVHQRPRQEAIRLCRALHAIVVDNKGVNEAVRLLG
ncbi:beta/alpha barrel domain-containing protein [Acidiferrobacter thiooxydans]